MREKVKWIEEAGLPDAYNRFIPLPASQPGIADKEGLGALRHLSDGEK